MDRGKVWVAAMVAVALSAPATARVRFARPPGARLRIRIVTTNDKGGRVITRRTLRACARGPLKVTHVLH